MKGPLYIRDFSLCCNLGTDKRTVWNALCRGVRPKFARMNFCGKERLVASVPEEYFSPVVIPDFDTRVNRLAECALQKLEGPVRNLVSEFGADRVGVFIGSSDNGAEESLRALECLQKNGAFPPHFTLKKQQANFVAEYVAERFGILGPVFTHSSACASSASVFASAENWIASGLCDAAIVGGVDVVSKTVVLGFDSLEAVSPHPTNPFSRNRSGLTIGEGAAFLIVSAKGENSPYKLIGLGESSDADHLTAPRADGMGATLAMEKALSDAGILPSDVDYVNLHGTGTELNDAMESVAVHRIFGDGTRASSTKGMTGHTLGAAGALEAAFSLLALSNENAERLLPVHVFDGVRDEALPQIHLAGLGEKATRLKICMSNSFGFGGCNVSLIFSRNG